MSRLDGLPLPLMSLFYAGALGSAAAALYLAAPPAGGWWTREIRRGRIRGSIGNVRHRAFHRLRVRPLLIVSKGGRETDDAVLNGRLRWRGGCGTFAAVLHPPHVP